MKEQLKNINQTELAKLCGWSKGYFSQKLSGKKPMTESDKKKIRLGIQQIIQLLQEIKL